MENTQCVFKLEITIINNGKNQWPENVKKLYLNKKSHLRIKGGNINLMPLKRNEKQKVNIIIERLNEINESEYIIYQDFKVNIKIFGNQIKIKITIKENK